MQNKSSFLIYDASAGSGKTFTLVKEYLKILYQANSNDAFKNILAITFTNKAVGEMKSRLIKKLALFASPEILTTHDDTFNAISEELSLSSEKLHQKSKHILQLIIHNYAAFDISTIDGFTHKLIRTFAHDLKLPVNFEVELDQESLLNEAVERLLSHVGIDKELTKILIDFAIEKADDDKSWDISRDLNAIAKLLTNENDLEHVSGFKNKSIQDFNSLKKNILIQISETEKLIILTANNTLELITKSGLEHTDFSRSTLPNHFVKASSLNFKDLYKNKLEENLANRQGLYSSKLDSNLVDTIETILPEIESNYIKQKTFIFKHSFLRAIYKNITPLSVLNAINKELSIIKIEQNKLLISEFNQLISNEIKDQPTPFIYERIGEKFRHYFIDEFQDTSEKQWGNLIPLIDNTLSGLNYKDEHGSAMLVGDAKQAIYRWRGGKARQFIDLYNKKSEPFYIKQDVNSLDTNYRSFKEIVEFNNSFFDFVATTVFDNPDYEALYKNAKQLSHKKSQGLVSLNFLEFDKAESKDERYSETVYQTILNCLENGYALKDICVLVRKKKEGVAIANYLSQNQINIVSSETMLISASPEVRFSLNILNLLIQPNNKELKIKILDGLGTKYNVKDKHIFFKEHINLDVDTFFKSFNQFDIHIKPMQLLQLPLYDLVESIVREFKLTKKSNAYIQFFLDVVLDYSQKQFSDIAGFLDYFNKKENSLSIVSPVGQDAVQIMTIHKSKGLEFPIVIFPYAELDIYREREPKEWFPLDSEQYNGFSFTLLNYSKEFEHYGKTGLNIHTEHQSNLELDNINLLYVALTRPVEQLYIIGKKESMVKGAITTNTYSGLLINYLMHHNLWDDSTSNYELGNIKKESTIVVEEQNTIIQRAFISTSKESHNIKIITNSGSLWDTTQEEAIEKGNLIHNVMSKIETEHDIDFAIQDFLDHGIINHTQSIALKQVITSIVTHPKLKSFFNDKYTIYNEKDIISKTGAILRPDRLVINRNKEAVIIDYKTGLKNSKYKEQLHDYQDILEEMNYKVNHKILVYINSDIKIEFL